MKPTDVWWIVEISVKNKEYQQPIFATFDSSIPLPKGEGENTIWGLIYNGQIWSGGETWGTTQNAILQGQTGTLWVAFESQAGFNSANTQIGYQGQEPFSYGQLTIGNTVTAYDWDSKKVTSVSSTKTVKPIIMSHTGYIEKEVTFENTAYYFQDGFVVSFPGVFNDNLLPPVGDKVEIKYEYDSTSNTNSLISINVVP